MNDDNAEYIARRDDKSYYYLENGNKVVIEDALDVTKPLLRIGEIITIPKGWLGIFKEELRTSVGCLLQNMITVIGPFNGKVSYINRKFKPSDVEDLFLPKWKGSKEEATNPAPDEIFTEEYLTFANNCLFLENFTQTLIPSVTEKALCTNPILEKRKKELYEEYKDKLDDQVIIARIDDELAKIDKEYIKGDESEGFLISDAAFTNVRKRLNTHFGMTKGLEDGDGEFISRSLREGMDITKLSSYVNDSYSGSIGRGLETQEGGVEVKNAIRSAANLKVSGDDCGAVKGQLVKLSSKAKDNYHYIGYSIIQNKKTILLTKEILDTLTDKIVEFRSPAYCVSKKSSYCKCCVGPNIADYPNGIVTVNATPGSIIMGIAMSSMHSSLTKTTLWRHELIS